MLSKNKKEKSTWEAEEQEVIENSAKPKRSNKQYDCN